jgi:signal transduction histidine kinase
MDRYEADESPVFRGTPVPLACSAPRGFPPRTESVGAAHDLLTVLGAVRANIGLARLDGAANDRLQHRLRVTQQALVHVEALARELLRSANGSDPGQGRRGVQPHPVDVDEVVHAIRAYLGDFLPPGVDLFLDLHAKANPVRLPRVDLERILVNLLTNALQAVEGGGRVVIATGGVVDLVDGGHGPNGAGMNVAVRISDSGPGLGRRESERLTSTAASCRVPAEGEHGIGLVSCREIVRRCGGRLEVASRPQGGTAVTVYFPVDLRPARRHGAAPGEVVPS